jgi:outer membrane protease
MNKKILIILFILITLRTYGQEDSDNPPEPPPSEEAASDTVIHEDSHSPPQMPYVLSISSSVGFKYGYSEEIVYKNSKSNTKLSQLLWNIKPLFYWGAALDFSRRMPLNKWAFFANVSIQSAFPAKTGVMEDRDWMAANNGLSHFSSHDNYTEGATFFDFAAGISLPVKSILLLKFFAGLDYMNLRWVGREGYIQYAAYTGNDTYNNWDASLEKKPTYGPVIYYYQDWLIFSPGVSAHINLFERFDIGLYFHIGPVIFCNDFDDHLSRKLQFTERMFGGIMLKPRGEIIFIASQHLNLALNVSYKFIEGTRGSTDVRDTSTNKVQSYANSGGAAYSVLDVGLSVTLSL